MSESTSTSDLNAYMKGKLDSIFYEVRRKHPTLFTDSYLELHKGDEKFFRDVSEDRLGRLARLGYWTKY